MKKFCRLAAVVITTIAATTAACSSAPDDSQSTPDSSSPQIRLAGGYTSSAANATYALIEFADATRYRAWRRDGGACAHGATGQAAPSDCAETGTYALTRDTLTMTDGATGNKTTFQYKAISFRDAAADGSLTKGASITPQSGSLVTPEELLSVPSSVELIDKNGGSFLIAAASPAGIACRAACWGVAAMAVAAVDLACAGATVITIGGVAIPCTVAVLASAAGGAAGASVCSDAICPP